MPAVDEFIQYLITKHRGHLPHKCPWCENENFVTNTAAENVMAELRQHPSVLEAPLPLYHAFYTISCTNCGYTMQFHRRTYDEYRAAISKGA